MRVAFPAPVPMHKVATPTCFPVRCSSVISDDTSRPPVAPRGCLRIRSVSGEMQDKGEMRTRERWLLLLD